MITLKVKEDNPISQEFYNSVIYKLQLHQVPCSCNRYGCLSSHGYYKRYVKTATEKFCLRVWRVICSECGKTHAILLSSMVPYSQISLSVQVDIIQKYEESRKGDGNGRYSRSFFSRYGEPSGEITEVDENNLKSIVRKYLRHWREKIRSEQLSLCPLGDLVRSCFACFSAQFLQIHRTVNQLFYGTT